MDNVAKATPRQVPSGATRAQSGGSDGNGMMNARKVLIFDLKEIRVAGRPSGRNRTVSQYQGRGHSIKKWPNLARSTAARPARCRPEELLTGARPWLYECPFPVWSLIADERPGGRVAQRESTPFTREGSQVQSLSRPPFKAAEARDSAGTHKHVGTFRHVVPGQFSGLRRINGPRRRNRRGTISGRRPRLRFYCAARLA